MKILSAENLFARFIIQYSLPLLVIGIISRAFPVTGPVYFIVPVLLIINILLAFILIPRTNKTLIYISIIFGFPVYCLITSIWSLYPIISLQRSLYLLLMYAGIFSSVLLYKKFYPDKGIGFLMPANIFILVLSAISLILNIPADSWTGGNGLGFMGFAGHQNTLAAALLFTLPGIIALSIAHGAKGKASRVLLRLWRITTYSAFGGLLLTFNFLLLFITYSRAAILALVIGTISYLIITKSKKILIILSSVFIILLVLYFTIPLFQNAAYSFLNKNGGNILGRRMILWEPSVEAAKQGAIWGLGYGVSAPDIKTPILTGSYYEDGRYIREKGNSVLAMIEETGLIGLLLFLLPVFYILSKLIINNFEPLTTYNSILTAALAAMLLHSQFEAWWVGPGSVQLPLYLIVLITSILNNN